MKKLKKILVLNIILISVFIVISFTQGVHYMTVFCDKNDSKYIQENNMISEFNNNKDLRILSIIAYNSSSMYFFWKNGDWESLHIIYSDNGRIFKEEYTDRASYPLIDYVIENNSFHKLIIKIFVILYFSLIINLLLLLYYKYIKKPQKGQIPH